MNQIDEQMRVARQELDAALARIKTLKELEAVRVRFLGKAGLISGFSEQFALLPIDLKRSLGPALNELRTYAQDKLAALRTQLEAQATHSAGAREHLFDVTAYQPYSRLPGGRHIYTKFIEEVEDIFLAMGFSIFDGPEVTTDFYNFTALNIPADHPARDMHDTFLVKGPGQLLRTHTSSIQIKALETYGVPIAGVAVGRVYRHEATDATHEAQFTQCEGLMVDRGLTLADLFGVTKQVLRLLFDSKTLDIRIRPGFFPFVEPGVEIDMRCLFCKNGCNVCKKTTWIEVLPGGLVHPNELRSVGIDADRYSGFAFALGVERLAMLRHGINDIRLFHSGDLRFLRQF